MTELALILVSAILVNNFVLVQFLGLCPFMGVSRKIETAIGLALATTFVLTLASICSYILQRYVLRPLDLEYLRTIGFILVIAVVVQFTELLVKKSSPLLYRVLGIFLPLITTNCIVLGVALLNANKPEYGFLQSSVQGFGAGLGFSLVLVLFAALRERIFQSAEERRWLEQLLHPLIGQEIASNLAQAESPYAILVSPLLVESGQHRMAQRVLVVDTPEHLQLERTVRRDNVSEEQVRAILQAQAQRDDRLKHADDILLNDRDLGHLQREVERLHNFYLSLRGGRP